MVTIPPPGHPPRWRCPSPHWSARRASRRRAGRGRACRAGRTLASSAAPLQRSGHVEAAPAVLHHEPQPPAGPAQLDARGRRLGVLGHVGERLLDEAVDERLEVGVEPLLLAASTAPARWRCRCGARSVRASQRRVGASPRSSSICGRSWWESWRTSWRELVGQAAQLVEARRPGRCSLAARTAPAVELDLERGERLPHAVVQLAGEAAALGLLDAQDAARDGAEALLPLPQAGLRRAFSGVMRATSLRDGLDGERGAARCLSHRSTRRGAIAIPRPRVRRAAHRRTRGDHPTSLRAGGRCRARSPRRPARRRRRLRGPPGSGRAEPAAGRGRSASRSARPG